jgi:hypothetical protein
LELGNALTYNTVYLPGKANYRHFFSNSPASTLWECISSPDNILPNKENKENGEERRKERNKTVRGG